MKSSLVMLSIAAAAGWATAPAAYDTLTDARQPLQWHAPQALPQGTATWQVLPSAAVPVSRPAAAWHAGYFYLIGGEESGGVRSGVVQRYTPQAQSWDNASVALMPVGVSNACAGVIGDQILVPGGSETGGVSVDVLQALDTATGTWTTVASDPLPTVLTSHGCTVVGARLYVMGGATTAIPGTTAWVYDPAAAPGARWSSLAPVPFATQFAGVAGDHRYVYVAGGTTANLTTVARFDTQDGTWSNLPAMLTGRGGVQMVRLFNRIYAVAGGWATYLTSVESLDLGNPLAWEAEPAALVAGRRTFGLAASQADGALIAAGGWSGTYLASAERRPRERGTWLPLPAAPVPVSRPAGVLHAGGFYLIGGEESGALRTGHTQRYDLDTGLWSNTLPAMPVPASNICAGLIGDTILVPGGFTGSAGLTTLQAFDTQTGTWSEIATDPLPAPRYAHGCAVLDGQLYVVGGSDAGAAGSAMLRYDPAAAPGARWSVLPDLPFAAQYSGTVADDRYLYVAAGQTTDLASVARFDPDTSAWTPLPDLNVGRGGPALLVSANTLLAVGGGWGTYLPSVEALDRNHPGSGWTSVQGGLNAGRRTFAAAGDGGTLIVAAGWAAAYLGSAELYYDDTVFANAYEVP